jgi:ABC-type nitrate/sulfonate/bicarbonate transport system substrate-binding protein
MTPARRHEPGDERSSDAALARAGGHNHEAGRDAMNWFLCGRVARLIAGATVLTLVASAGEVRAQVPDKISMVVFGAPSLGAFLPPIIKAKKIDEANQLDITFHERTPDAYLAQFYSGEFKVGGSASVLTIGLGAMRGVKMKYLFNLFDFWGAVVTSRPEVKSLKDLEGRQLAAARATNNYVMFEFFAKKLGVDVAKIEVVNTATPGLVGYALANRADAVQIWEPAYTLLAAKKPDIRNVDQGMEQTWKAFAGGSRIPYLGVAAHTDWIEQNQALIPRLYATYKAAAEWSVKNPDEAASLISPKSPPEDLKALAALIRANDRLAMNVSAAVDIRKEIDAVYRAGAEVGYLTTPPSDTIYDKPLP